MAQPIFGVPYAYHYRENGKMDPHSVVCPECGKRIFLKTSKDWESSSAEDYADHYMREHSENVH